MLQVGNCSMSHPFMLCVLCWCSCDIRRWSWIIVHCCVVNLSSGSGAMWSGVIWSPNVRGEGLWPPNNPWRVILLMVEEHIFSPRMHQKQDCWLNIFKKFPGVLTPNPAVGGSIPSCTLLRTSLCFPTPSIFDTPLPRNSSVWSDLIDWQLPASVSTFQQLHMLRTGASQFTVVTLCRTSCA